MRDGIVEVARKWPILVAGICVLAFGMDAMAADLAGLRNQYAAQQSVQAPPAVPGAGPERSKQVGQEPIRDMQGAVARAVSTHPNVQHAVSALSEAGEAINVARAGYYPQLRGGLSTEYNDGRVGNYDKKNVQRFTLSATQMLYDFGKVSSNVDRSEAERIAARARVLQSIDQVSRETALAFVEMLRYRALQGIAEEQIRGVTAIADLARERREMGASTLSDEMQAQAREEAAKAMLFDMQAQFERWQANLRHLTGGAPVDTVETAVPAWLQEACHAPQPDWNMVPALLVAEAQRVAAAAALDGASAASYPTLALEGSAGRALNARTTDGDRNEFSIMLNVSMPFYQGGALQAQKRAASHAVATADSAVRNAKLEVELGLSEARTRSQGFMQRTRMLEDRTSSILLTRDLYRQQYLDLGTRSLLDLLNAEQEYHQARIEHNNNQNDMHRMQIECLYSTGRLREAFDLDGSVIAGVEIQP